MEDQFPHNLSIHTHIHIGSCIIGNAYAFAHCGGFTNNLAHACVNTCINTDTARRKIEIAWI
jgi:hypothetical protein